MHIIYKTNNYQQLYKLLVIQFGFINIPAIFQKRINSILAEYLNKFIIIYLDNIIIYFNSKQKHYKYIKWVL